MTPQTNCPKCKSENIYEDGVLWICPECSHEWTATANGGDSKNSADENDETNSTGSSDVVRDANGNILANGDTVTVIKDLKVKGASSVIKSGTKVKNIRLSDAGDGHDIACKIDGFGAMNLKSEFVRKV